MKTKACSWRDMRRIKHVLENMDRLKGEYDALIRCGHRTTVSTWRSAIEVMESCDLSHIEHFTPTHAREIARNRPKEEWEVWVKRCEREGLTVSSLRGLLLSANGAEAASASARTTPEGKFTTIVVDPPWSYQNKSGRQRQEYADRTMNLEQVKAFDVARWLPDGPSHLYLWVTDAYAGFAYQIFEAWGFSPKAWLVWVKDRIGMGNYFRHQHEFCVFGIRGKMRLKRMDASTVFTAPITVHSEKPDAFYYLVESCSPGPYIDVFARKRRDGWAAFGDELDSFTQLRMDKCKTT